MFTKNTLKREKSSILNNLIVWSNEQEPRNCPSGENLTFVIDSEYP